MVVVKERRHCGIPDNTAMPTQAVQALLISHAAPPDGVAAADLQALGGLRRALSALPEVPAAGVALDAMSRSTPHEVMLARALQLPTADGCIPLAARRAQALGHDAAQAWAFVSPCHWAPGADHIRMHDPATLALQADEAQVLREAMVPWFEPEGIRLLDDPQYPTRWLACGEPLRGLSSASVDRVSGRSVDAWMPDGPGARLVRRLQSEMQMLLYQHPLHDARRARGLPPVNSFWLHGTGDGVAATKPAEPTEPTEPLIVIDQLREASLAQDGAGWLAAWASIESRHLASVPPAQLVLCGERRARVFAPAPNRWWQRLAAPLRPGASAPSLHVMLSSL
jgi:hypothetical protein